MKIVIIILSIIIFIKTTSYGIYELKEQNKSGGFTIIITAIISLVLPILAIYFKDIK